jgi:hypothetical protein
MAPCGDGPKKRRNKEKKEERIGTGPRGGIRGAELTVDLAEMGRHV